MLYKFTFQLKCYLLENIGINLYSCYTVYGTIMGVEMYKNTQGMDSFIATMVLYGA
jgi:hypothetical protein